MHSDRTCYTGIRPDLAKDQFSPPYIFLQDQQTEIQNTNWKNIDGVPISDFGQGDNIHVLYVKTMMARIGPWRDLVGCQLNFTDFSNSTQKLCDNPLKFCLLASYFLHYI